MKTVKDLEFKDVTTKWERDNEGSQYAYHADWGSFTVLDRMTGFGCRDVETGFRDPKGNFWCVSGNFSIRSYPDLTISEAIELIKQRSTAHREVEQ